MDINPWSEEDGPIWGDRKGNENERAEARAASLSLHTPTISSFESLPGDLTRSPAAMPIGCLTTRVLLMVHGIRR